MELVTREVSLPEYLTLAARFEQTSLYHGELWLGCVRDGLGAEIRGLLTESHAGEPVALTPLMRVRKAFVEIAGSPLRGMHTDFAGPLCAPEATQEALRAALRSQHVLIKQPTVVYIEWGVMGHISAPAAAHFDVLSTLGYEYTSRPTLVVDLAGGVERAWNSLESRARNMVRKAEKQGVKVKPVVPSSTDVALYYEMLAETFHRQGRRAPHPFSFFEAACTRLVPAGLMRFLFALKGDRVIAGALFLRDGPRMLYMSGTSTAEGARLAANSLLQWAAIQWAVDSGLRIYDLGGLGNAAIDKFKSSFGGVPCSHHRWVYKAWPLRLAEPVLHGLASRGLLRIHG